MNTETLKEKAERIKEESAYEEEMGTIEEAKAENIYLAIHESRQHPGVSLENIAAICVKVFDKDELMAFIKRLQEDKSLIK